MSWFPGEGPGGNRSCWKALYKNLEENLVRLSHSLCENAQIDDSKGNFKGNQRQEAFKYQEKMEENACNASSV